MSATSHDVDVHSIEAGSCSPADAETRDGLRDRAALRAPSSSTSTLRLGARQAVFDEGEHAGQVYEIVEGLVLLSRTLPDGRRQVLEVLGPGMLLGVAVQQARSSRAETITSLRLRLYSRHQSEASGRLQRLAMAQLETSVKGLSDLAVLLGRRTAPERIAAFLLKFARLEGQLGDGPSLCGPVECTLPLTQADIADYLGLSVETVCRELAKMKRSGHIALNRRGSLRIADAAQMAKLAEQTLPPSTHGPAQARMQMPRRPASLQ